MLLRWYFVNDVVLIMESLFKKGKKKKGCEKAGGTLCLMKQLDGSHALIVSEKLCVL